MDDPPFLPADSRNLNLERLLRDLGTKLSPSDLGVITKLVIERCDEDDPYEQNRVTVTAEGVVHGWRSSRMTLTFQGCTKVRMPLFDWYTLCHLWIHSIADRQWDRLRYAVVTLLERDDVDIDPEGLSFYCHSVTAELDGKSAELR